MAKTKLSKSDAIRKAIADGHTAPLDVVDVLAKQGIDVKASYVSVVKSADKIKSQKKTKRKPTATKKKAKEGSRRTNGKLAGLALAESADILIDAVRLVRKAQGHGPNALREIIAAAEKVVAATD